MCGHSRTVKTAKFIIEAMGGSMMISGAVKLPLSSHKTFTENYVQNHLRGSVTQLVTTTDISQNRLCTLSTSQMVKMAFCDLSHKFQKYITNVSLKDFSSCCEEY